MIARFVHRYLDPSESLLEILFGLIMALTMTAGARLLQERTEINATELAAGLAGCNVAWGLIDAVFYLFGTKFNRNRRVQLVRRLQATPDQAEAFALIQDEFGLEGEPPMREQDRLAFHQSLLELLRHAGTARAHLHFDDYVAAGLVFVLVSLTAVPGVLALLLLDDAYRALRIANAGQILLLFLIGFGWANYTGAPRWRTGTLIALLGVALVMVSVALGG